MSVSTIEEYKKLFCYLKELLIKESFELYRQLFRSDLYFLIRYGFNREDIEHPWLLARCKEVQDNPNGYLDLWSREHYKSSIITFALTIQDILASHGDNPLPKWNGIEPTFGIFSHTRPIAIGFLRQIKRELESNRLLKSFFPDILWDDPSKEAVKWSEYDGLVVKRKGNPKESTIEAWGVVESQPTGKHFFVRIYDDVVTVQSVGTPDSIRKTLERWEMSINLGVDGGFERYIGTRYHFNDLYRDIISRKAAIPRIYAATDNGKEDGAPVFWTRARLDERRQKMGAYTFATQMLQNPLADESQVLNLDWLRFHDSDNVHAGCNVYLLIDPASEKKKSSDYTSMWVLGLGTDEKYRVLDLVRDRLNLTERGDYVFRLHRKWRPMGVGYEKYGMQADVEYLKERMQRENYYFEIIELGGQLPKNDRIKRLIPSLEQHRWLFPQSLFRKDYQGKNQNLVEIYINEEYSAFPVPVHDDMLDCQSRIIDSEPNALWPRLDYDDEKSERYSGGKRRKSGGSAWSA